MKKKKGKLSKKMNMKMMTKKTSIFSSDESTLNQKLGAFIYLRRTEKKVLQSDLAKDLGVSQSWVSKFESGLLPVDLEIAFKISKKLEISWSRYRSIIEGAIK